jgi:hypothetical protein
MLLTIDSAARLTARRRSTLRHRVRVASSSEACQSV